MYHIPKKLLSVDTNAKTIKGRKYGFMTAILYLAPADISGINVCPMAKIAQCETACLFSAGRGAMNSVQSARVNKTAYFHADREAFLAQLAREIDKLVAKTKRKGLTLLVRLNGTSDIRWENMPVAGHASLMAMFPDVQFYDYTKIANRKDVPANYDLTFSYSGVHAYLPFVEQAKRAGMRIAVVFRSRAEIPASFIGLDCVDGDDSDVRHMDPRGVVVALYAKGKAKTDITGFVVDASASRVIPIQLAA